jgi:hypothetical protein
MTLRFIDPKKRDKFIALCRKKGVHGKTALIAGWWNVTVDTKNMPKGFTKRHLIAAWASASVEEVDSSKGQQDLPYRKPEPVEFVNYGPKRS